MNKSESIANLAAAMATAQSAIKPAAMTSTNPFLKNKYADLGNIIEAARPALAANGLSFAQPVSMENDRVAVETVLMHKSGEWMSATISLPMGEEKGRSLAQNAGSIITYLRRYSLAAMLGIYADEDTDGNGNGDGKKQAAQQHKPQAHEGQPAMTLEEAGNVLNSEGKRYGDIDSETLAKMSIGLGKVQDPNDEQLKKLMAIKIILSARN